MLDLHFEFGGYGRSGRNEKPPIGIAASALEKDRRHRPKHTPQRVSRQENRCRRWRGLRNVESGDIFGDMPVTVETQHTGDAASQREVVALIEHLFADRPGDWRVSIVGSQANERWEMRITGPNAFERSYTLEGSAGEHSP